MTAVCFYFQVHQPYRLRPDFDFFAIGQGRSYEDEATNAAILRKVAARCYLPANRLLLELIRAHAGAFRVAFSISGVALEQFAEYEPSVLSSFRELVETGAVEILGETYYHSLAFVHSPAEFQRQVRLHADAVERHLGVRPTSFRNTELIYSDALARALDGMGYEAVLAEGADRVLGWRSPGFVYQPPRTSRVRLLLKHYRLSDDVAFRFSNRGWSEWPLTVERYADWLAQAGATGGPLVNLFMDYETFGEHQWAGSGIFDFLRALPAAAIGRGVRFVTPTEAARTWAPAAELSMPDYVSWADSERDLTAWQGNHMQDAAARAVYALEGAVLGADDPELLHAWGKLQTSDHFYYMCTKFWADGDVHKYFSPYESPYDAFVYHCNALNELRWRLASQPAPQRRGTGRRPGGFAVAQRPVGAPAGLVDGRIVAAAPPC
jgi:alpha-amylase